MKLFQYVPRLDELGGTQFYVKNLIESLKYPHMKLVGFWNKKDSINSSEAIFKSNFKIFNQNFSFGLLKYITRSKYDTIHVHGIWEFLMLFLVVIISKLKKSKIVFSPHSLFEIYEQHAKSISFRTYCKIINLLIDKIIVASEYDTKLLKNLGISKKATIIPYGINQDKYLKTEINSDYLKVCGIQKDDFVIIYIGRFAKNKGIEYLIDAISILEKKIDNLRFVAVYASSDKEYDKFILKKMDKIQRKYLTNTAEHTKKVSLLKRANVLVFPSLCDSFGLVLLEALVVGVPILATYVGGFVPFLEEKNYCQVIKKKSSENIAKNLSNLYYGHIKLKKIPKHEIKKFDISENTRKMFEEYIILLSK